ncbi:MAG: hypothetical protein ABIY62_00340 [Ginsengibacter sp.]
MKKTIFSLVSFIFIAFTSFGQITANTTATTTAATSDKMYKHSGEVIDVKIIKVGENTITYKYPGEDAEQVIGKLAVSKIIYSSGRTEDVTEKVMVAGKDDWEKVQIVTDPAQVVGLKKGEEVRGKTSGMFSYNSAGSADKKAARKIKEAAAEAGAPFVLLTSDKSDGFGIKQSIKNGVLYTYK